MPGRKTDASDAEWLTELLSYGLLKPSFIPPKPQRDLRDLTRYRSKLVQERSRLVNRVQKLLETANIKLSSVATNIFGVSGQAMLDALAQGESDAATLADLAVGKLRKKLPELEKALTGVMDDHHRFLLSKQLVHVAFLKEQIEALSAEIERQLETMETDPEPPNNASTTEQNHTESPTSQLSWEQAVEILSTIPGVSRTTAEVLLAEMGIDMNQFPTARHLAAWAGLAPGNLESGGKRYSGRTRKGNKALRTTMVQAAWAASRTKDTYLSALYRRLAPRRGKKRAIVAVAHSMLVSIFYMLSRGEDYHELGAEHFDQRRKQAKAEWFTQQLSKLGFDVTIQPTEDAA